MGLSRGYIRPTCHKEGGRRGGWGEGGGGRKEGEGGRREEGRREERRREVEQSTYMSLWPLDVNSIKSAPVTVYCKRSRARESEELALLV